MGSEAILTAEMVTAMAVFMGSLFGGVVAVIAELRRPIASLDGEAGEESDAGAPTRLLEALREEGDHLDRTLWVIEKKLSEHLHRIERAVLARDRDPR